MFVHPIIRHDLADTVRRDAFMRVSRAALLEEPMNIDAHADALGHDLAAAADLGDERVAAAGEALARAARPALRIRMLDALSEAALEVSSQLPEGRVEVRLAGDEAQLVFVDEPGQPSAQTPERDAASARISLRLSEALKARVDDAAARDGVSANTWLVQAISRSVERRPARVIGGRRITGYAQG